ncbi:MAG: WGR domain-containing protein [Neisseriaceae bacterium]
MIYMQNRQKMRYYSLHVEQDLFDTWRLIKSFGSIISRRGRIIKQVCDSEEEAWEELTKIEYNKRQRGYTYADLDNHSVSQKINTSRLITSTAPKIILDINQIELLL